MMVGNSFTVTVNAVPMLTQPFAFFTVMVPVYVPAAVAAGMLTVIGDEDKVASVTAAKVLDGVPVQTMLYVVGVPVVAL